MRRRTMLLGAAMLPVPAWARGERTVDVLYAGSLLNLMERGIAPAFDATGADIFRGYAGGSGALVNQIRGGLRRGDVFISADPALNGRLGDQVGWYIVFARSPLVIGYNPQSAFANALRTRPWYEVLQSPGIRIGRTDPALDPKGALTVQMLQRAEAFYHQPGLAGRIMGADRSGQVRPEENLVGRLQSGQIDVGFFYAMETADLHIPSMELPPDLSLAARYSVTILKDAPNPDGAARFVAFLLGREGSAILRQHGLEKMVPVLAGDDRTLPALLRPVLRP
ncbi:extracellular solute-binding protein [Gluconacetobacter sp. Hr-1-5]|uniref:extracellular solute-binding protein n=1 Tax=Gluconacetobacter sp. Hr-1-5 TaxID=3395370 RepID=UPI003B51D15A